MKEPISSLSKKIIKYKVLIENFSSLTAFQMLNLFLPLITYPYLIRVLGKEKYGLIIFAQTVISYLLMLVSFGFNISATKEISIYRNSKNKLSEIVSSVLIIKSILFLLSLIILSLTLFFLPQAKGYEILFFLTMWTCLYDLIFPIWYFQGIEKMKYITYITLISRVTFVAFIFLLVKGPDDYLLVPSINGLGAMVGGFVSLYIVFKRHKIKFTLQSRNKIEYFWKESLPIFISNVSIRIYLSSNKIIIGSFIGLQELAYYDLGEKLTSVLKIPQSILGQALFPKISNEKNISFIKKAFKLSIFFNILLTAIVMLFSKQIILFIGGEEMLPSYLIVNILLLSVPIIAMSNVFGIQLMVPFGKTKLFTKIIVSSSLVYLIQVMLVWLIFKINIYTLSLITLTTETIVTIVMFSFCKRHKLW